jgi:hypothetical protein
MFFLRRFKSRSHRGLGNASNSMTDIPGRSLHSVGIKALGLSLLGGFIVGAGYGLLCGVQASCSSRLRLALDRTGRASHDFVFNLRARKGAGDQAAYEKTYPGHQKRIPFDRL